MQKITHLSIFKIYKENVFLNVNSYGDMNNSIKEYANNGESDIDYKIRAGEAFEIFTQFFCQKYGNHPLLGIKNVLDTSDDPFTMGYDFTFTDFKDQLGMIQSKWKSNPTYTFKSKNLATNGEVAYGEDVEKDNNILFINFDDREDLFDYNYKVARKVRRILDRKSQEDIILRDPLFWDDFRKTIEDSSRTDFEDPYNPRDIQSWILNGHEKDNIKYDGTDSVLSGKYKRGRIEASTGAGKTLCQFYNIDRSFKEYGKDISVMVLPTRSLINQTFSEFYKWKMFGYEQNNDVVSTNVSAVIIMSGGRPRYNSGIVNVLQSLNKDEIVKFVVGERLLNRKVVIFTTMKSQDLKYSDIVDKLKENNIRIGLEIVDEYHNIISNSSDRSRQLEIESFLRNSEDRCDGALFYSASNKRGEILSTFNVDLFGPLLAKINRNDLRIRGYVCPHLIFKMVKVNPVRIDSELRRDATRQKIDIEAAQIEAGAIIAAYNDLKRYYANPNLITFGDHVEGCRYITKTFNTDSNINKYLPNVKNHFMAAETSNSERDFILTDIKSGKFGNILHQHSVAKEGINLPNLSGSLIGRGMSIISLQQAIGRSDRALYEDTLKFINGELDINNPDNWKKYYNIIYLVVDDDESFVKRTREVIEFLLNSGIPEDEWEFQALEDDERNKAENKISDYSPEIKRIINFEKDKFKKMVDKIKIEVITEQEEIRLKEIDQKESNKIQSMNKLDLLKDWNEK